MKILIPYVLQRPKLMSLSRYHKSYRLDISDKQGGILIYIKSHLPSRLLSSCINTLNDIQRELDVYVYLLATKAKQSILLFRETIINC